MITTHDSLTVIAAAVAVFAIILLGIAVRRARHAQRAAYYVTRRHSQDTANRQFLWAMALLLVAAGVFIASRIIPQESRPGDSVASTPAAGIVATILLTAEPTATTPPTEPAATPTDSPPAPTEALPTSTVAPPTAAASPSPEPAILPTETSALRTDAPIVKETETPPVASGSRYFTLRAIAGGIDLSGLPVNPSLQFEAGAPSIYIFFDFQNVPEGRRLRHNWFRDGGSVYFESMPWERPGSGNAAINWSPPKGFPPGIYEVRVFLDDQLQFVANFEVK